MLWNTGLAQGNTETNELGYISEFKRVFSFSECKTLPDFASITIAAYGAANPQKGNDTNRKIAFDTAPFSAAIPLSGDDGSYIFVNTGLPAAGAAGGGAGSGAEGLLKKHIGYSPNCEEDCSSKIFCRNSTTERCPPRHIRSACVSDNSGDLLGKR